MEEEIVSRTLKSYIDKVQVTASILGNEKNSKILKEVSNDALMLDGLANDEYLLSEIRKILLTMPKQKSNNVFFPASQSSYEISKELLEKNQKKIDSLSKSIHSRIKGMPVMSEELYKKSQKGQGFSYSESEIIQYANERHLKGLIDPKKSRSENAQKIVKIFSRSIKGTNTIEKYKVFDGYDHDYINNKKNPRYLRKSLVEACLHVTKKITAKEIESNLKVIADIKKAENIFTEVSSRMAIELSTPTIIDKSKLNRIFEETKKLESEKSENNKNIQIIDELIKIIDTHASSYGNFNKLKEKMLQERKTYHDKNIEISAEISKKNDEFNQEIENQKKVKLENEKKAKELKRKETIAELKRAKEELERIEKQENKEETNEEEKPIYKSKPLTDEEKNQYEKYKLIRERLDTLFENKNQYRDEETFRREVVRNFPTLGSTYEEIMDNISDIRNNLAVASDINRIIQSVKNEFNSVEEMTAIESNGLTALENRVMGRMLSIEQHGEISPELKSEFEYYIKRLHKLESELKWIPKPENIGKESYKTIADDTRIRTCVNTSLIEENGLTTKVAKGR